MDIASKIREKRKEMGLTQKALAEEAGIAWQTISYAERGKAINMKTLEKIINVLGMNLYITD